MSEAERRAYLAEAGHNAFRLPRARVAFDLLSDVPHRMLVPAAAHGPPEASADEVREALAPLTGDVALALATKGRAAEIALVDALELAGSPVVLTHGLFSTTQAALARRAAVLEDLPLAHPAGTSEIDLDHLEARLARGGVSLVYLELANNAMFGWPLGYDHLAAVRAACDRHGARLVLDAARPLANSAGLQDADLVGSARRILGLAHAFTMSCAKELLVPIGSVIGSSDAALIARAGQHLFRHGTSMTPIDPVDQRANLRDGARHALGHPQLVRDRLAVAHRLAARLIERGVDIVQPVTAHAVYVPIDRSVVPPGDLGAMISLLAHVYVVSGTRAQVASTRRGPALRLALPLLTTFDDGQLDLLAGGIAASLARLAERAPLRVIDGQLDVAYFARFAPVT
ncbi:MAG TPA: beta-eliminating lyase-related protein [Kofleriaceae bacterium]|nr:beta-eliminating lyase-related protein [Kofleriaceae bacterium]